ncbi:hypothetical protein GMDG_04444 [Pseudogymnoascus destructans 20631-21]|uniref:Glutathione S-transferase n=1 Tax=Pseudogymnoascus destructans (strain ATCC MYA-4855 / 20631-21) TaxID=658429 RepID=L8GAX5_PSED2|nr:hypothetical protein GMDG_04444 [Pseudogymnoascus destructans 20631-21]
MRLGSRLISQHICPPSFTVVIASRTKHKIANPSFLIPIHLLTMAETTALASAVQTSDTPQITLYWLEQSRSQRILWLLIELSLPYTLTVFHRDPKTHFAPPELKAIHPLGKSPVISIKPPGGGPDVVLAESGLIAEYLTEHFGAGTTLAPQRWQEGKEGQGIKDAPVPFFIRPITSRVASEIRTSYLDANFETTFSFLEEQIKTSPGGGKYLCGEHLTAADILISFPLIAAKVRGGLIPKEKYPLLKAYVDMLEEEEGYKKSIAKVEEVDGKFSAMI